MILSIIAAVARNGAIGYKNKLLYRLKGDMKRFKELTTNHTIIMGKNTFLSLPKGALPNRRNIVLTRKDEHFEGCETFHSIDEALEACKTENEVFIIGGAIFLGSVALAFYRSRRRLEHTGKGLQCFGHCTDTEDHQN